MCYFHLTTACIFIQRYVTSFFLLEFPRFPIFLSREAAICLSVHLYVYKFS